MQETGGNAYGEWPAKLAGCGVQRDEGQPALDEIDLLRAVADAAFEAILIHRDGRILATNHRFAALHGYRPEEVVGRDVLDFVAPECREKATHQAALGAREVYRASGLRQDGSTFYAEVRGKPISFSGQPARAVSVLDISPRMEAEEALRATQDELRQTQKLLAVGHLAAGIAHDFNNLLTIINGYNHLIQRQVEPGSEIAEAAGVIQRTSHRAAALTKQLLAFSRRQVPIQKMLSLNQVVCEVDCLLQRVLGEHICLEVVLGQDLHPIRADQTQLDQIILNLAINARDAMPEGGKLRIVTENAVVDECAAAPTGLSPGTPGVRLLVSDEGMGMSEETRLQVFDPFFTTKPRGTGTGLGLVSVLEGVRQNGGFASVESQKGVGTTFSIFFPAIRGEIETPEPDEFTPEGDAETGLILLVEDDDEVRFLARQALVEDGFAIIEARSGLDALRILKSEYLPPLDLLITDVVMPGMCGPELAERLAPRFPGLKVLFITGYPNEELVRHGVNGQPMEILHKPFTPEGFVRTARKVMQGVTAE